LLPGRGRLTILLISLAADLRPIACYKDNTFFVMTDLIGHLFCHPEHSEGSPTSVISSVAEKSQKGR